MAEEYSKNQLNYLRSKGVSRAWARERALVAQGRGTRSWSVAEQKELLRMGRVRGYQGHHMKSVNKHPDYADDPKNIQFLDARKGNNEHLRAHRGDYRNESDGRYSVHTGGIRPMAEGKPRAMNSYELKDKAIEKRGYTRYRKEAGRPETLKKGTAKPATTFNGKSYQRSMVKRGKGSEKLGATEKAKTAARSTAKPKASERARSGASGGDLRYGAKTAARSRGAAGKSSGSYGKARAASAVRSGASGYGRSAARGGGGASRSGGPSHGAGRGR